MDGNNPKPALAEAKNGLVAPLYFQRQVVRADDLTLDRASHDAELARMRRLLHGWGVVAGLIPEIEGDTLTVSRGYAVTPTGEEVYLSADVAVDGIAAAVLARCGPPGLGCDEIEPARREAAAAAEGVAVTSWLIARPTGEDAEPRPGIAAGCAHPANALFHARRCGGVRLELLCALPASHTDATPPTDLLTGIVCGPQGTDESAMLLPMPELSGPEASFVILGRLILEDGIVRFRSEDRRTLLPLQTLQTWVASQTCPALYYVNSNAQNTGEHEVHRLGCPTPAREQNRIYLGTWRSCDEALEAARQHFDTVDGCANCLPDCHTR